MEDVPGGTDFSFPQQEESILRLWESTQAFQKQLKLTEACPEYVFYDGPPFATGKPHYGHILAGTIKDVVTRYQSMRGRHVTRRFGWDCHGLPVEFEIDTALGIRTRNDVLAMGIDRYNEACRGIVTRYVSEWEEVVTRTGRWIDFENDYKTMDPKFMESVWWVFAQLYEKGLVYRGFKVMPYSTGCKTPLANFEAGLNYKDVSDPAIMVAFPVVGDPDNAALVAWTTTPWTLPSNLALCVNANFSYVKVKDKFTGATYIVAESRKSQLPVKKPKSDGPKTKSKEPPAGKTGKAKSTEDETYTTLETISGASLVGMKYEPLFDYFLEYSGTAFRVVADNYVTDDSGTGVVHCAPSFGEDDYRVCIASNIIQKDEELIVAVDDDGCFTEKVSTFQGRHVKEADKDIIQFVKGKGRLVSSGNIMHSYPYCWRSDTPLLYRAVPSWFVAVEKIKDKLLESNKQTYWVPDFVKEKRFHNWLENARDWAVSRSRFWGTPLPVWVSKDGVEKVVIDSITKLEKLSGAKVTDLHRHHIDHITIPSSRGPEFGMLRRVDDVFDCWFESGSMPYAYIHYPFENKDLFEKNFPGDFVAEGLDQTRGWFYTLMVLSTALFEKPAFRNLICNGLILAEDGKKMAKRLKNYPSPMEVIGDYGADALRLYLINSPVVRAEPLRFKKDGVYGVVKDVFLPWYNAYRFLVQNAKRLEIEGFGLFTPDDQLTLQGSLNVLDQWINSSTESLVHFVRQEMEAYRLYTVVPYLLKFIDNLTNIYVRFNRKRLKGRTGERDCRISLSTLYHVLLTTCIAMAPFTPFFTEVLYQNLRKVSDMSQESIHHCSFPPGSGKREERIEQSVTRMMTVIDLARNIRERHNKPLKAPLKEMVVVHPDSEFLEDISGKLKEYVMEELNVKSVLPCNDPLKYASLRAEPDFSVLGKRLGRAMGVVANGVKAMSQADILAFEESGEATISGHSLKLTDIKVVREFKRPDNVTEKDVDAAGDGDVLVILDLRADESLFDGGIAREVINRIQKLRKKSGLEPTDIVEVYYEPLGDDKETLERIIKSQEQYIKDSLGSPLLHHTAAPSDVCIFCRDEFHGKSGLSFAISIAKPTLMFDPVAILELYSGNKKHAEGLKTYLLSRDLINLKTECQVGKGKIRVDIIEDQPAVDVEVGKHLFLSVGDYVLSNAS
ncbi:putative isoleucine--tRNA ligase, cytoplasmic [Iris pallida]|uniref:isoleucine--tRNA ligase n=1 Tax=Iris pallida TaxID=29817 RepID=A0AAX6F2A5_IRIPA|nr:putative isoleucine--tRNA ligase, cytoplasmic [Iris pallida]KAJ6846513.1 putative isoleucine--tRNA ligase, cytoplasmic [Iris pallida]